MIYGYVLHITDLSFVNVTLYLFYTVILGFIPVTIRAILVRNWRLRNDLSEAKKINELLANRKLLAEERIIEFQGTSSKDVLRLSTHDLLYLEAAENYITIVWENNRVVKKGMIRMTMKEAIKKLNDPLIAFCHRSYIVNLRKVKRISSQSGISTITLKGLDGPIPLSTTHKREIKQKLKEFQ
jgi:DNA-binding LytR/AlgR family response regulator